jgi:hypothetical protein
VACKDWLQAKEGKSMYKKQLFKPTKVNTNLVNRRAAMKDVAEECLGALVQMDPGLFLQARFDTHKVRSLATGDRGIQSHTLSSGYNHERTSWLTSGKTRAIAGSGLNTEVHQLGNKKKKSLSDLDFSDYAKLDKLAKGGSVMYMKKAERLDKMMVLNNASLLCHAALPGTPATTAAKPFPARNRLEDEWFGHSGFDRQLWMYAMDSYGNLFISKPSHDDPTLQTTLTQRGLSYFNHSTFNAGREVTCAGFICIENGLLRWIDNNSGHYKPGGKQVQQALKLLDADGADLSETIGAVCVYSNTGGLTAMKLYDAQELIDNGPDFGTPFKTL